MAAVATVGAGADTEVSGTGMDPVSVQQRAVLVVDAACHVHVDILIKPGDDVPAVLAHHLGMQERACILAAQPDDAGVRSFTGMPQFLRSRAGDGRQGVKRYWGPPEAPTSLRIRVSSLSGVPVEPHLPSRKYDESGQFIPLAAAVAGDTPAGGPGDALEDVVLHDTVGQAVHGRPVTAGKPARDLLGLRHSR